MEMTVKRRAKGPLLPSQSSQQKTASYDVKPPSRNEMSLRAEMPKKKRREQTGRPLPSPIHSRFHPKALLRTMPTAKEFDSSNLQSPLLDPKIIDQRIAVAKQKTKNER